MGRITTLTFSKKTSAAQGTQANKHFAKTHQGGEVLPKVYLAVPTAT